MPKLDHVNHENLTIELVGDELRLKAEAGVGEGIPAGGSTGQVLKKATAADYDTAWASEAATILEAVAGGAGFVDVSGAVTLDLATGRAFHHVMTGNITSLAFTNVPTPTEYSAAWTWVLKIDATGGYTLAGTPTVTFVDGMTWSDLDLSANAENIITFWRVDTITYAALSWNGQVRLDPYKACFLSNATLVILTGNESIDVANATKSGNGTVTYEKNGVAITTRTSFAAGDGLGIVCSGATDTTSVSVPRYAL